MKDELKDEMQDELTNDAITASFRILQRRRGHRYSLDDLATAWEAARAMARVQHHVDLGCGIGSVLLMVAYKHRQAKHVGIEAEAMSAALARDNVALNQLGDRVHIIHGDLRDVTQDWAEPHADLVTGTPPYLPPGSALASPDPQRAAARIELRGGIEDYLLAAARILCPGGLAVVCADARKPERVLSGADAAALYPLRRRDIVPRADAAPLFSVWVLSGRAPGRPPEHHRLLIRGPDGEQTDAARALRSCFGL